MGWLVCYAFNWRIQCAFFHARLHIPQMPARPGLIVRAVPRRQDPRVEQLHP